MDEGSAGINTPTTAFPSAKVVPVISDSYRSAVANHHRRYN
jgi:hypothetical protein